MNKLWKETLQHLENHLSAQHFSTWIKPIRLQSINKDIVHLEVPNRFVLDWVRDNYARLIQDTLSNLGAVDYKLNWSIGRDSIQKDSPNKQPKDEQPEKIEQPVAVTAAPAVNHSNLNPKYTFDAFVSGSSNQFAHAAAMAVAANPATTYNPLFIYGGVGLGKTHLVNAIGNAMLTRNPQLRVCYYASEKFMN